MDYRSLWAKSNPYHPLWCHLLDIAAVCETLLPRFGGVAPLPTPWVLYFVAMHDIGKADSEFQNKDETLAASLRSSGFLLADSVTKFRHEARSAEWIRDYLTAQGWRDAAADVIGKALRGHHGNFRSGDSTGEFYNEPPETHSRYTAQWATLRRELSEMVRRVLNVPEFQIETFENASVVGVKLSGLIVLSDWIASNDELYHYPGLDENLAPDAYFEAARSEAKRAVQRLALDIAPSGGASPVPSAFCDVWPDLTNLRPSQRALEKECLAGLPPGLLIIEAPMGEGKTEGAIYVAEHWNRTAGRSGTYIALPTMATSNQVHSRYAAFLRRRHPDVPEPRLLHGMAWLIDDDTPTATPQVGTSTEDGEERATALDWFRNAKRALLAPEGVGTVDQVLRAALNVKHGFLRFLGLAPRVLVIDEVHAYDEYMTTLMEKLLEWCRALEIPVILLSATLSRRQKARLVSAYGSKLPDAPASGEEPYPLLTFASMQGEVRTIPVENDLLPRRISLRFHEGLLGDSEGAARLAWKQVRDGGCACVLANTVKEAQAIHQALQTVVPPKELFLFHARFRAEVRQEIEKQVEELFGKHAGENRPKRAVLVATQVVEQSLDVDFDVMLSQLAPIDLLLQRCGRLHRHERDRPANCREAVFHILLPAAGEFERFGGTGKVYDEMEPLLRTMALLYQKAQLASPEKAEFVLPDDFRPLVEGCYSDRTLPATCVPDAYLTAARAKREKGQQEDRQKAVPHLIPEPSARVFKLGQTGQAKVEGEEGEAASYFRPQTRLGDDSVPTFVLHDPALVAATTAETSPGRAMLKRLFLQKVNLPGWWLKAITPMEGFEPCSEGQNWLRNHRILPMQNGVWRGRNAKGQAVTITDSPILGLTMQTEGEPDDHTADI